MHRLAVLVSVAAFATPLAARADGFDAQVLRLAPVGRGTITIDGTEALRALEVEGSVLLSWAKNPVEMSDADGQRIGGVVDGLAMTDLRIALGLPARLELGASVPLLLDRQTSARFESLGGPGLGDVSVGVRWSALTTARGPIGLALTGRVILPTGDQEELAGAGSVGGELDAIGEVSAGVVRALVLVGARGTAARTVWHGSGRGAELVVGGAVEAAVLADRQLRFSAEVAGAVGLDRSGVPAEALLSARWIGGPFAISVGGGAGLSDAPGTPDLRALLGIGVRSQGPGRTDRDPDADGIDGSADRCPFSAEDDDGYQDGDGCPDSDNDGDSVADATDRCPMRPEDQDGFEDVDGCPDEDNDRDRVPDGRDRCPNEPEDVDTAQDDDGCPEGDNDGDGVADAADRCPAQPENPNGFEDTDGCPDTPPPFVFRPRESIVFHDIDFRTGSADLLPTAIPVLDQIVASLQAQQDVRVRVEGHTDDRGADDLNLVLSQRRALAVVNYLSGAGVDRRRLEHEGYGETQPIESNDTDAGRARNRRVVLEALDR